MTSFEDRERERGVTLNRIGRGKARLYLAQFFLARRAGQLRELPPWAHDGVRERAEYRFFRAIIRASEARHALSVELHVLASQGASALAEGHRREIRGLIEDARAKGRAQESEATLAN